MIAIDWAARLLPWMLGIGLLLASLRLLLPLRRLPAAARPRPWRTGLLLLGQFVSVALLFLLLRTPDPRVPVHTLHLLTAHAPSALTPSSLTPSSLTPSSLAPVPRAGELWLRLPEAPAQAGIARTPDLASALRQHPGLRSLHVLGDGLEARDRDAASGLAITFDRAPLAIGFTDWWAPQSVRAGETVHVRGRANGPAGSRVELLDPAGKPMDQQRLQGDAGFTLRAVARSPGLTEYRLRLRDADNGIVATTPVPVDVQPATTTRLLLRSGGPDPELKFLRRWAADNGATLRASIDLGRGMQAGDPPAELGARTLADVDVLILDDRSWNGLGRSRRDAVLSAVGNGMGLLLRASAPLADGDALGLQVRVASLPSLFKLPASDAAADDLPALGRPQLRIDNPQGHTVIRDNHGTSLAAWRTHGRGRIAAWLPNDTFKLALSGHGDIHAQLWADAINAVMRPRAVAPRNMPARVYAGERTLFCELGEAARVIEPDASAPIRLVIDPRSGGRRCAAFWPQHAGWHRMLDAGSESSFLVRAADADPVLRASRTQQATMARASLVALPAKPASTTTGLPRWPLFLLWLAVTAGLWWFERSRIGRDGRVRTTTPG